MNITAFEEFLHLINACYQLDDKHLKLAQTLYQTIYQDISKFKQMLADELDFDIQELEGFDPNQNQNNFCQQWFYIFLIFDNIFPCYFDDWRFYCEDLSEYIRQYTKTSFSITDEEYLGDIDNLLNKLESQTSFSLLHIYSGGDDVHFYLINKTDKPRALELAKELGIWID